MWLRVPLGRAMVLIRVRTFFKQYMQIPLLRYRVSISAKFLCWDMGWDWQRKFCRIPHGKTHQRPTEAQMNWLYFQPCCGAHTSQNSQRLLQNREVLQYLLGPLPPRLSREEMRVWKSIKGGFWCENSHKSYDNYMFVGWYFLTCTKIPSYPRSLFDNLEPQNKRIRRGIMHSLVRDVGKGKTKI